MKGVTIKWRIKILSLASYIYVGIGKKKLLKNNDFLITNCEYDKHGCYYVRHDGYSFTYLDK